MHFNNSFDDGKPQTIAFICMFPGFIRFTKALRPPVLPVKQIF
jgi:hypothetical protein